MMLGELERVTEGRGRGGGRETRMEEWGLHTLVAPALLMAPPPWWAGDSEVAVSTKVEQADGSEVWGWGYSV